MPAPSEVVERAEELMSKRLRHRVEEVIVRDPEPVLPPAHLVERRLSGSSLVSTRRHGHWLLVETEDRGWLGLGFGPGGDLETYRDSHLEPATARFIMRFDDGVFVAYDEDEPLGEIALLDAGFDQFVADEGGIDPMTGEPLAPSRQVRDAASAGVTLVHIGRTADLPKGVSPSDAFVGVIGVLLAAVPRRGRRKMMEELPRPLEGLSDTCLDDVARMPPINSRMMFLRHVAARLGVGLDVAERLTSVVLGEIHTLLPKQEVNTVAKKLPGDVATLWRPRAEPRAAT